MRRSWTSEKGAKSKRPSRKAKRKGPSKPKPGGGGSRMSDLCAEDKAKIRNLLREVAEQRRRVSLLDSERRRVEEKVGKYRDQNLRVVRGYQDLRTKLARTVALLRAYQTRVRAIQAPAARQDDMPKPLPAPRPYASGARLLPAPPTQRQPLALSDTTMHLQLMAQRPQPPSDAALQSPLSLDQAPSKPLSKAPPKAAPPVSDDAGPSPDADAVVNVSAKAMTGAPVAAIEDRADSSSAKPAEPDGRKNKYWRTPSPESYLMRRLMRIQRGDFAGGPAHKSKDAVPKPSPQQSPPQAPTGQRLRQRLIQFVERSQRERAGKAGHVASAVRGPDTKAPVAVRVVSPAPSASGPEIVSAKPLLVVPTDSISVVSSPATTAISEPMPAAATAARPAWAAEAVLAGLTRTKATDPADPAARGRQAAEKFLEGLRSGCGESTAASIGSQPGGDAASQGDGGSSSSAALPASVAAQSEEHAKQRADLLDKVRELEFQLQALSASAKARDARLMAAAAVEACAREAEASEDQLIALVNSRGEEPSDERMLLPSAAPPSGTRSADDSKTVEQATRPPLVETTNGTGRTGLSDGTRKAPVTYDPSLFNMIDELEADDA